MSDTETEPGGGAGDPTRPFEDPHADPVYNGDDEPAGGDVGPDNPGGEPPEDTDPEPEFPEEEGNVVELRPPSVDTSFPRQWYRTRRWLKKREKLIGDGYVQWYLIGDAVAQPKFVKPKRKGGGIPELDHDNETYLFPRKALVPSEDGMWTCIHREGEADPINIRDPARLSIKADELKEYLTMRVSSSAPGFFDGLGLDMGDLIKIAIAGLIGYAMFQQFAGGGL